MAAWALAAQTGRAIGRGVMGHHPHRTIPKRFGPGVPVGVLLVFDQFVGICPDYPAKTSRRSLRRCRRSSKAVSR